MTEKILDSLEQTVNRHADANDSASEGSEGNEENGRESLHCLREYLNHHE